MTQACEYEDCGGAARYCLVHAIQVISDAYRQRTVADGQPRQVYTALVPVDVDPRDGSAYLWLDHGRTEPPFTRYMDYPATVDVEMDEHGGWMGIRVKFDDDALLMPAPVKTNYEPPAHDDDKHSFHIFPCGDRSAQARTHRDPDHPVDTNTDAEDGAGEDPIRHEAHAPACTRKIGHHGEHHDCKAGMSWPAAEPAAEDDDKY